MLTMADNSLFNFTNSEASPRNLVQACLWSFTQSNLSWLEVLETLVEVDEDAPTVAIDEGFKELATASSLSVFVVTSF